MEKTSLHIVAEPKRQELIQACYQIIGCMQEVHNQLGAGLPEYIYQEALATELTVAGYTIIKNRNSIPYTKAKR